MLSSSDNWMKIKILYIKAYQAVTMTSSGSVEGLATSSLFAVCTSLG